MGISVVINTYNAEEHLRKVLESVKDFDEVLICDMYSTDKTIEISKEYGCAIIYHENAGFAEPARTCAIKSAKYEWVLMIDADEVVTRSLKTYLYEQIKRVDCPSGFRIARKNYFMGRFMRCAYPDYILRFFRKELTVWPPYVHSQPEVNGLVERIPAKRKELAFIHLANDSVKANINKTNIYTDYELIKRKDKPYSIFSLLNETFFRFFKYYILKGGFKDGKAGLAYAGLNAFYKYATIAKLWEDRADNQDISRDMNQDMNQDKNAI